MSLPPDVAYDPETLVLLKAAFEDTWRSWLSRQNTPMETAIEAAARHQLAWRFMQIAACGERDPERLRALVLDASAAPPEQVAC